MHGSVNPRRAHCQLLRRLQVGASCVIVVCLACTHVATAMSLVAAQCLHGWPFCVSVYACVCVRVRACVCVCGGGGGRGCACCSSLQT